MSKKTTTKKESWKNIFKKESRRIFCGGIAIEGTMQL